MFNQDVKFTIKLCLILKKKIKTASYQQLSSLHQTLSVETTYSVKRPPLPSICHKGEDSIVEEHDGQGQQPIRQGEILDVCQFLLMKKK